MSRLPIPDKTRQDQLRASDPEASAWVSANAGSGKTCVLVQRMIRLMLRGVPPDRILALTYTKAAAANMATRVFDRLASWVGLDDEALRREIVALQGHAPRATELARARRLFAQAIETPGGLKIQTIHAFCERLLQLFPFEANVAARFSVLDETTGGELLAEARDAVLRGAAAEHGTPLSLALGVVAGAATQDGLASLLGQAMTLRPRLSGPEARPGAAKALGDELRAALGLTPADTADSVRAEILRGGIPPSEWRGIADALDTGSGNDKERAASLREAASHGFDDETLAAYRAVFFTKDGEPRKSIVTRAIQTAYPSISELLEREKFRVSALLDKLRAVDCHERTAALLVLLEAIFARYEAEKSRRGALDFDDLIARTQALLQSHGAGFVLYKLDAGIEHVLIDEAQDTSRAQWDILRRLTSEFFAGEGSARAARTVFAVGDPKQSIYSFQGAAPDAFAEARDQFRALVDALAAFGGKPFEPVELHLSFRSVPSVLSAVDRVFADKARRAGLTFDADDAPPVHEALRRLSPGHVEIWDITRKADREDPDAWARPVDEPDEGSAPVQLAGRIARMVRGWLAPGSPERIEDEDPRTGRRVMRPIRAGDVLVLVRSRGALFDAVIRALKDCGVPVAGADRLALASHIAVQDLLALGQASLTPDDDLTFAAVLKSPLVGLTDDDLLAFAPLRKGSAARALREAAPENPRLAAAQDKMLRWRTLAGSLGPFAFFSTILGAEGGRRAMLRRLGTEAADALDEFLRLALEHEQREIPSLQLFLAAFASAEPVIKRDMEAGRDEVRVMTVHGAKGLEAPIVILPDSCGEPNGQGSGPNRTVLFDIEGTGGVAIPAWSQRKADDPAAVERARQFLARRAGEEYRRLLYVAMTRARDRLYVAGASQRNPPAGCWYQLVREALGPELVEHRLGDDTVYRWDERRPDTASATGEPQASVHDEPLPDWLHRPAPTEPPAVPPLRPSSAVEGAEAGPGRRSHGPLPAEARAVGRLVHELLEVLPACPADRRRSAAESLARARGAGLDDARRLAVVDDVLALLARGDLAALFGPRSRAEVPITGTLPLGPAGAQVPVSGQIDRLVVTDEAMTVADFKTGQPPPPGQTPPHAYVAQLAIYRALLRQAFPGRRIDCVLVWTAGPRADVVDPALLDQTLAGIKPA